MAQLQDIDELQGRRSRGLLQSCDTICAQYCACGCKRCTSTQYECNACGWVYPDVNDSCDPTTFTKFPFDVPSILGAALGVLLAPPPAYLSPACAQVAVVNLPGCAGELGIWEGCCSTACAALLNETIHTYKPGNLSAVSCYQQLIDAVCLNNIVNPSAASSNLETVLFQTSLRCTTVAANCAAFSPAKPPSPKPAAKSPKPHRRAAPKHRKPPLKRGCGKQG